MSEAQRESEMRRCPGCLWREGPPCNSPVCGRKPKATAAERALDEWEAP